MGNTTPPDPQAPGAATVGDAEPLAPAPRATGAAAIGDPKALVRSIIGTAIGLATLLLMLAGLVVQQNAGVNARIDDVNARIDDTNASVNARIDDLNAGVNARIDDLNASVHARIDDVQEDIRDLRGLIIEAIPRADPAN